MPEKSLILVTNDDGIHAPGLLLLAGALGDVGEVVVYAPADQQSAVGHGITLHHPLRVTELRAGWHMVDGTPTDCVMLAVRDLLGRRPDLVVSGINPGANLGDDVTYSGTVAGAFEGMLLGVPAFAVSTASYRPEHMDTAARVAARMALEVLRCGLPPDTMLNVNVPDLPHDALKGAAVTRMGRRDYQEVIVRREDPRGGTYYWIGGDAPGHVAEEGTDFEAIERGQVSITPLHRDLTHHAALNAVRDMGFTL
jgi:5'-nucleotidase